MLTTYDRVMSEARVTRHRDTTYDHRDPYVLIAQLEAEVEALRARVRELQSERPEEAASVSSQADEVRDHA